MAGRHLNGLMVRAVAAPDPGIVALAVVPDQRDSVNNVRILGLAAAEGAGVIDVFAERCETFGAALERRGTDVSLSLLSTEKVA